MTKEALIYTAFTVDALNTFVSFPMFVIKGRKWALENITDKKDEIPLSDADRPAFMQLWELFMIAYEGYFGFTASTLVCIYKIPESIPIFAYSLFALYVYKLHALLKGTGLGMGKNDGQYKAKVNSILFFFLPCYGGYCGMHFLDYIGAIGN
eukprot:CAMPEP_0195517250 /NCGR_PEP_ID=MMETSP0794_2-20130614/10263_1 /TAXON_ID=515487 /ORGANISM="Stephanopyxis turris, Strain CCMP 815" /LENGTH=151 /DNA_ID=CAMNT_0040646025 /DNA_START=77 /DNA_END=532 /DNA_ORIENTATION=-